MRELECNRALLQAELPQSGKLPVLNLLTGQKSGFSPRRGDSLHRVTSNLAGPTGTWVRSLGGTKFHLNRHRGWECGPKMSKKLLFGKESPRRGNSLDRFLKFSGDVYLSYISVSNLMPELKLSCYWVVAEKQRVCIRPNFSVHPVGKTMRWIKKMNNTFFDWHDQLYHRAKLGEDRTMRAGCRCKRSGVCFVCLSHFKPEHRAFEGA